MATYNLGVTGTGQAVSSLAIAPGKVTQNAGILTAGQYGVGTVVAAAVEQLLTSTLATTVLNFTPPASGIYLIECYFRVVTAATTVTIQYAFTDGGGAQTVIPVNAVSEPVGSYSLVPYLIHATTAGPITVTVTAGTANQVYVTAAILGL